MPTHIQDTVDDDESNDDDVSYESAPKKRATPKATPVGVGAGAGKMSTTTLLLGVMVGALGWVLSFAFGWIPGVSWLISFCFTAIQAAIVYFDPSTRKLPIKARIKVIAMRELILFLAGAFQGIPFLGEIIPFEALAMFLLRIVKIPMKGT